MIKCNLGDEIIYPSPGFPIYESFIKYVGVVAVPLHLREDLGFSFTVAEIYENILFDGSRNLSIASIDGIQGKTIIASGASKSYPYPLTGGRIGWAVFPTVD